MLPQVFVVFIDGKFGYVHTDDVNAIQVHHVYWDTENQSVILAKNNTVFPTSSFNNTVLDAIREMKGE